MQFFVKQMRMRNKEEIISKLCYLIISTRGYNNDRIKTK